MHSADEENLNSQLPLNVDPQSLKELDRYSNKIDKPQNKHYSTAKPIMITGFIIIILLVVIEISLFLTIIPGAATQKLKENSSKLGNYVVKYFGGHVDDDKLENANNLTFGSLQYLEDMGYDLKGFGLLSDYVKEGKLTESENQILSNLESSKYKIDENIGVVRDLNKNVILAHSDFVYTYIVSDNYIYTKYKENREKRNSSPVLENYLYNGLNNILEITKDAKDEWGKGFMKFYSSTGTIGRKGTLTSAYYEADINNKKIYIALDENSSKVGYNVEGWSGKYGMPLELLMSVHTAIMSPDLAYDMATGFPTNVNIILNEIGNTIQPYIADVTNHWYRNVYFAINPKDNINIVDNDYNFQVLSNERTTLYETYSDDDENEYAKLHIGDFKLYLINEKGNFVTDSDKEILENITDNSKIEKQSNNLYIFYGTKEDALNIGVNVSKRATTVNLLDSDTMKSYNWSKSGGYWTAYKELEYWNGDIIQKGDGLRSETNPKIKQMFLNNVYFKYDGNVNTSNVINALRKRLKNKLPKNTEVYGALNALKTSGVEKVDGYELSRTYNFIKDQNSDYTEKVSADVLGLTDEIYKEKIVNENGNTEYVYKKFAISDYTGQAAFNQDSLNIINILENMHTIDADYVCRDFKELVVELNYFSKESLDLETADRVLEFPVAGIGNVNYPYRNLDKRINEYGTYIHSKGDIDAHKSQNGNKILDIYPKRIEPEIKDFISEDESLNVRNPNYYSRLSHNSSRFGDIFIRNTESVKYDINCTNIQIVEEAKMMSEKIKEIGDFTKAPEDEEYPDTFDEAINSNRHYVNDSVFVYWVLKKVGLDVDDMLKNIELKYNGYKAGNKAKAHDMAAVCIQDLGAKIVFTYRNLQPGDVMIYIDSGDEDSREKVNRIDILGEQNPDGTFKKYGLWEDTIDQKTFTYTISACAGLRFAEDAYIGYSGNEMVVSPVTGVLLEYGTYDGSQINSVTGEPYRENVDLKYDANTKVSDKVGYAKILVLDTENYLYLEQTTDNRWNEFLNKGAKSLVNDDGTLREELIDEENSLAEDKVLGPYRSGNSKDTQWSKMDQTVYGYKEFLESYKEAGISGNIIYIDGFVCEEPDENLKDITQKIPYENDKTAKKKAKITMGETSDGISYQKVTPESYEKCFYDQLPDSYIPEDYYELENEKATNKFKAEVMVKDIASNSMYLKDKIYDLNGESEKKDLIFIKEGTILGRTITDKELLESSEFRNNEHGSYKENRAAELQLDMEHEDPVIGNYIRVIMRDLDKTPVENIEDYYKLGDKEEFDWFSFLILAPHQCIGIDAVNNGPESYSTSTPGELGFGISQWTTLLYHYQRRDGNGIMSVIRRCIEDDYKLCNGLEKFLPYTNIEVWRDATGDVMELHNTSEDGGPPYGWKAYLTFQTETGSGPGPYDFDEDNSDRYPGDPEDRLRYGYYGTFDRNIKIENHPIGALTGYGEYRRFHKDEDGNIIWGEYVASPGRVVPGIGWYDYDTITWEHCRWEFADDKKQAEDHIKKESELKEAARKINEKGHEKFFRLQREYAMESQFEALLCLHPHLEDRPTVVKGILHHMICASAGDMPWLTEDVTDEEILAKYAYHLATVKATTHEPLGVGELSNENSHCNQYPAVGLAVLKGIINKYQVELWVRTGNGNVLEDAGAFDIIDEMMGLSQDELASR